MKTTPTAVLIRVAQRTWRRGIWACVALAAWLQAAPAPAQIVAGYYPEWRRWSYPPSAIPLEHLTHVIYCFAFPNADGTLSYPQGFFDPVPDLEKRVHAAGKKLLISIGGALDSEGFAPMAANATTRARFVSLITGLCLSNRFDGVDLDWEFPASAAEGTNLTQLVREIRAHWNQVAPQLMLTMAIGPTDWSAKYFDVAALNYAYHWDGVSQVPYLVSPLNGGTIVPFDDPTSVRLKAQYAKSLGLAGVAIWELSQDAVAIGNQPLLAAIGEEMLVAGPDPEEPPPPPPPAEPVDDFAVAQSSTAGTASGSLAALAKDDNVYQSIKERLSNGAAKKAYSYLSHTWTFNVTGGGSVVFHVQAHRTGSADGDNFTFAYSTNNVAYVAMLTTTKTKDDNATQSFALPSNLKGKVYVRVQDSNRVAGKNVLDAVYVDQLFIRSAP